MEMRVILTIIISLNATLICIIHKCVGLSAIVFYYIFSSNDKWFMNHLQFSRIAIEEIHSVPSPLYDKLFTPGLMEAIVECQSRRLN